MRILLAQNSLYYPAHGGGDKSNRLLMEALAARGHECRAVARISVFGEREERQYLAELAARGVAPEAAAGVVRFARNGVDVHVVTNANPRAYFAAQAEEFHPDVILASTDDPAQLLLEAALRQPARARRLPGAGHPGPSVRPRLRLSERSQNRPHSRLRPRGGRQPIRGRLLPPLCRASMPCTCPSRCWSRRHGRSWGASTTSSSPWSTPAR